MNSSVCLELGRLLVVSDPLAVIYCEEGGTPENEELAEHMKYRSKLTVAQMGVLERLHDGDGLKAWSGQELIITGEMLKEVAKPGGGMTHSVGAFKRITGEQGRDRG